MPEPRPQALELLETRRSVPAPQIGEPGPSEAEIRRMMTVAVRVPDHGKLTPWRFVLYRGPDRAVLDSRLMPLWRTRFPDAPEEKAKFEARRFSGVPLTVGVISTAAEHVKIPVWEQELSVGAATMNLILAAGALGYAANWLTGWLAGDAAALEILGVKPSERLAGLVAIGTATVPPVERPRPAYEDVVTEWRA